MTQKIRLNEKGKQLSKGKDAPQLKSDSDQLTSPMATAPSSDLVVELLGDEDVNNILVEIGLVRKYSTSDPGKKKQAHQHAHDHLDSRGMPTSWIWTQVTSLADSHFEDYEDMKPFFLEALHALGTAAGVPAALLNVELEERNPVDFWATTADHPDDAVFSTPIAWLGSGTIVCTTSEQLLSLAKKLIGGFEKERDGEMIRVRVIDIVNHFSPKEYHPAHVRDMIFYLRVDWDDQSVVFKLEVAHADLVEEYNKFKVHYQYFWKLADSRLMTQREFDQKFEIRLVFLMEAIGVPVLLSLLYAATLLRYQRSCYGAQERSR